jgi:hypothetical protein
MSGFSSMAKVFSGSALTLSFFFKGEGVVPKQSMGTRA